MPSGRANRSARTTAMSAAACALALWLCAGLPRAVAQPEAGPELSPVFINDDPAASESLTQLTGDARAGRTDQAVRAARDLLLRHAETLVTSREDPDLHVTARDRLHALLLAPSSAALLDAYRQAAGPEAEGWLDAGRIDDLERSALLTTAGLTATVRVARGHLLGARFALAWRTLNQLRSHPDLGGERLTDALACARDLCAVWPDARAGALLKDWSTLSGKPADPPAPVTPPAAATRTVRTALTPAPAIVVDDLVPRPLFSGTHGPEVPIDVMRPVRGVNATGDLPKFARELRTVPSVVGDTALVLNGRDLKAFDVRTMLERWNLDLVVALGLDQRGNLMPRAREGDSRHMGVTASEDLSLVGVGQGRVGVVTLTVDNARSDPTPDAVTGIDIGTGEVRWSLALTQIDPGFANLRVRGPILIDNDVTVLCCRKWQPERRLSALYLVAIDTYTGAPRWSRLVGSAGAMPYPRNPQVSDGGVLLDGVVYRSDRLGIMGAYEAFTGRPLWVRRMNPEPVQSEVPSWPWQMNIPVAHGGALFLVSPDRKQVLKVNAQSGVLEAEAPAERYADAQYLVGAGDTLAAIGENRAAFIAFDQFGEAEPRLTPPLDAPGIRGRAVALVGDHSAGEPSRTRILLPVLSPASGLLVADPTNPRRDAMRFVRMDEPGTITALSDRLLTADDARLNVYLRWDEAASILQAQLAEHEGDPTPAVRLVEFAYAAGKPTAVVAALREAVRLLAASSAGAGPEREALRARLVRSVLDMLDASLAPARSSAEPDARRAPAFAGLEPDPLPLDIVPEVLAAVEPVCATPDEQASRLLLASLDQVRRNRPADAVASLQRVLAEPALADATFKTSRLAVSAGGEAATRLESILRSSGRAVYATYDQALDSALGALSTASDPDAFELLAERYPIARSAPAAWLRAATLHAQRGMIRAEQTALDRGLKAVARIPDPPLDVVGELAGRLVWALRERGLTIAAGEQLRWVRERYPGARLTRQGAALADGDLAPLIADTHAWPLVGEPRAAGVQTLQGWAIMNPVLDDPLTRPGEFLVLQHERGKVALFGPRPGAPADAPLTELCTLAMTGEEFPQLMKIDHGGAVVYITGRGLGRLARLEPGDNEPRWRSEQFASFFDEIKPEARAGGGAALGKNGWSRPTGISTPSGDRPANEILLAADDRSLAMVQRTGRVVVLDAATGEKRFAQALDLARVHDAALIADILVVAGQRDAAPPAPAKGAEPPAPQDIVLFFDARTGNLLSSIAPPSEGGPVHWLRPGVRGDLVVGMTASVACIDPARPADTVWTLRDHPAAMPGDAWLIDDRLFILDEARELWLIDATSGRVVAGPLDTRERIDTNGSIMINRRGQSSTATYGVRSPRGVAILSADGALLGADAMGTESDALITPIPTAGGYIGITTPRTQLVRERASGYTLFWLEGTNGMLEGTRLLPLNDDPERIAVMDGRVAVTTGHSTVVMRAPVR